MFLFVSEILIWLFTSSKLARKGAKHKQELMVWVVLLGWMGSITISYCFVGEDVNENIQNMLLPHFVYSLSIDFYFLCSVF